MNDCMNRNRAFLFFLLLLFICCNRPGKLVGSGGKPSFEAVNNIRYTEVRRTFNTGLSFDKQGYQLEPFWQLYFSAAGDSVRIYSPERKRYMPYKVYFDHDSVINMGLVWLRVKQVSPDSLRFQVLEVKGKEISRDRSNLYMTFLSDRYISDTLRTSMASLRKPSSKDSAFVRSKINMVNANRDSAFAARSPAVLESESKLISVKKLRPQTTDPLNDADPTDEYMYPEFNITIKPAYKDFAYSFTAVVDRDGRLHYGRSRVYVMPEFVEARERVVKGIIKTYLNNLLKITPGKTLGMPHNSHIFLNVKGIAKDAGKN